tara:strand:+ start:258 stop:1034 length:777 start_codon:yes stop_codon:yes gene_type:complete
MGSKKSTSSNSGGGGGGNNQQNKQVSEGTKYVKEKLGIGLGGKANKLKGKDQDFYGIEASKATDDYLVEKGKVKVGNYFRKEGGQFIRISKEEGERLYAQGDPSISRSTIGNKESQQLKYGNSGAMGSGDNSIMGQVEISEPMFKSQQRFKTLAMLGMSAVLPGVTGSLMRASALYEQSKGYNNYKTSFLKNKSQGGSAFQSNVSQETKTAENETANMAFGDVDTSTRDAKDKFKRYRGQSKTGMDSTASIRKFWGIN